MKKLHHFKLKRKRSTEDKPKSKIKCRIKGICLSIYLYVSIASLCCDVPDVLILWMCNRLFWGWSLLCWLYVYQIQIQTALHDEQLDIKWFFFLSEFSPSALLTSVGWFSFSLLAQHYNLWLVLVYAFAFVCNLQVRSKPQSNRGITLQLLLKARTWCIAAIVMHKKT